jgi:hypothetical protein
MNAMITTDSMDELAKEAYRFCALGVAAYIAEYGCDDVNIAAVAARLQEVAPRLCADAIRDAREAMGSGMDKTAVAIFKAHMMLAGHRAVEHVVSQASCALEVRH